MSVQSTYFSLGAAIRMRIKYTPTRWLLKENGNVLSYYNGTMRFRLIKNRWSMEYPIGIVRLSWWTNRYINKMIREHLIREEYIPVDTESERALNRIDPGPRGVM